MMETRCGAVRFRLAVVAAAISCGVAASVIWADDATAKTDGVRTVYLIRHGDYDSADPRDPDVGKELVPLGVAQARLVAARLRGMPVRFSSLSSSTMTRARQTALVIGDEFPELQLETSRLIRECLPPNP